ncbi:hypothetical protein AVCANL279_07285 [Campylobacter canadensis]|uniref:hypothetical protein n=1 Tax=Campylobacter canadensis TaxID=449520 RepID=UPI0015544885|nr:hypothetical protein [Campylobacter canadensis]MBZ7995182.1 hypothetical protein [Campylobacter canadensis]MBZ7997121.1 hypothetical protein [Campylobacter canadensis]MBZ8000546.1 hypothetical protein [Campylobacter canadensis]MBZ8003857.1 hypothetical protein [Campylobacter canadensis]
MKVLREIFYAKQDILQKHKDRKRQLLKAVSVLNAEIEKIEEIINIKEKLKKESQNKELIKSLINNDLEELKLFILHSKRNFEYKNKKQARNFKYILNKEDFSNLELLLKF